MRVKRKLIRDLEDTTGKCIIRGREDIINNPSLDSDAKGHALTLLREKKFFEKVEYKTTSQRIGSALKAGGTGFLIGATAGTILGAAFGARPKSSLIIGTALGSLAGYGLGKLDWHGTSKESVDRENKRRQEREEYEERIKKDPSVLFKEALGNPTRKKLDYQKLEKKYGFKFTPSLYKLIGLQKEFIPTLTGWAKRCSDTNVKAVLDWFTIVWPVLEAADAECWLDQDDEDDPIISVAMDVTMADDTWITYSPLRGGYSCSPFPEDCTKDLKTVLLDVVGGFGDAWEKEHQELAKLYYRFIKSRL